MRRRILAVSAVAALVAGCAGAAETTTSTSDLSTETSVTTTLEVTTTAAPATTTSVEIPTTTIPPTTTVELPPFPPERTSLEHGGDAWVVVLAGAEDFDDPVLLAAQTAAEDAGYTTGPTDCDAGAAELLGLPEGHYATISVYLDTEADANAALAAFQARGVEGAVGVVQTFCLD